MGSRFPEDGAEMGLDGALSYIESLGNALVVGSGADQQGDLSFSVRQILEKQTGYRMLVRRHPSGFRQPEDQPVYQSTTCPHLAPANGLNRFNQQRRRYVGVAVTCRPGFKESYAFFLVRPIRERDDLRLRIPFADTTHPLYPVWCRQRQVQQYHVDNPLLWSSENVFPVGVDLHKLYSLDRENIPPAPSNERFRTYQ